MMPRPYDPIKAERSKLIRALGGHAKLPRNAAKLIDDALASALRIGAMRERDHTAQVLGHPKAFKSVVHDTYGLWLQVIAKPISETTAQKGSD